MRIAIVNFTSGGLSGGYRKYLSKVVPLLQCDSRIKRLDIFTPVDIGLASKGKVQWHIMPLNNIIKVVALLKRHLSKLKPDIVFIPTARWINFNGIPTVIMVQNMEPHTYRGPNPLVERAKNILRRRIVKSAAKKANRIIAVSDYVKRYVVNAWRIPEENVGVVYHGVNVVSDGIRPDSIPDSWIGRFLFNAGSIRPARGIEDVLRAFAKLPVEVQQQTGGVVIAGSCDGVMHSYFQRFQGETKSLGINEKVRWVGELNEREMTWCYENCGIFVMTSRVEACPNIALEAMANGCIIVATDNPPMPELFRDTAVYYSQKRPDRLAYRIKDVIDWPEEKRQELRRRASTRASLFSWNKCAEETILELKNVLNL